MVKQNIFSINTEEKGYSRFVKLAKISCVLIVFLIILFVIIKPLVSPDKQQFGLVNVGELQQKKTNDSKAEDSLQLIIKEPNAYGVNSIYGPYNIRAERIEQRAKMVELTKLVANLSYNGGMLSISSDHGLVRGGDKKLSLSDNVVIRHRGYELTVADLVVNNALGQITSDKKTTIVNTNQKLISGGGFNISQESEEITFLGGVNIKIDEGTSDYIEMSSERVVYFVSDKKAQFQDNVRIANKNEIVTGMKAVYDQTSNQLVISGNVVIARGKNRLNAEIFKYNFNKKSGIAGDPKIKNSKKVKVIITPKKVK
jgi:hypothetical protein